MGRRAIATHHRDQSSAKMLTAAGMPICHPDDSPDRFLSKPTRAAPEG